MYEKEYKHRQCLITNVPAFAQLSRDCDKSHVHTPITPQQGTGLRTKDVQPFSEAFCEEYARLLHLVLTSPDADRCVHCIRDREIQAENAINDRDQVGRLAETHLASLLPAMSANSVTLKLHDWEEGRGVPSQNEFVCYWTPQNLVAIG